LKVSSRQEKAGWNGVGIPFGPTREEEVEDGSEDLFSFGVQGGVEAANRIEM